MQFTLQMSANQGILPFGDAQKAAVSAATQALCGPLYGEPLCHLRNSIIHSRLHEVVLLLEATFM